MVMNRHRVEFTRVSRPCQLLGLASPPRLAKAKRASPSLRSAYCWLARRASYITRGGLRGYAYWDFRLGIIGGEHTSYNGACVATVDARITMACQNVTHKMAKNVPERALSAVEELPAAPITWRKVRNTIHKVA
jgi:hypothetical protein